MSTKPRSHARLETYLLGPLESRIGGKAVALAGPNQRGLLAILALNSNQLTSLDALVDALWPTAPPKTAVRQVQDLVSRLRRAIGVAGGAAVDPDAVIETRPRGYMLGGDPDDVDATRFTAMASDARGAMMQGQHQQAIELYDQALELWRGPLLPDIHLPAVRREAQRLNEQRIEAHEGRIDCTMALGQGPALVGQLRALVEEYPLKEMLRRQLMLALRQAGRRAEALEVFRAGRTLLVEELGIEPGAALQDAHRLVLCDEDFSWPAARPVVVARATRIPRHLPPDLIDFTGRVTETERIRDLVLAGPDGSGELPACARTIVVRGGAGIGKSALAVHVAHLVGASFPGGHLVADLGGSTGVPTGPAHVLDQFLRDLGTPPEEIPADLASRTTLLRTVLAERRVLILLDDAVDDAQVLPLLPAGADCAVIVTSQNRVDLGGYAIRVDLEPFRSGEALLLLSGVLGSSRVDREHVAARQLVEECGGLPLMVRAIANRLADRTDWQLADMVTRLRSDQRVNDPYLDTVSVRNWLERGYGTLDRDQRKAFRRLAEQDRGEFNMSSVSGLLAARPEVAEDVVERLVDGYLLIPRGDRSYEVPVLLRRFLRRHVEFGGVMR